MQHGLRLLLAFLLMCALPSLVLAAKTHKVKKHESLTSLARKYRVSVNELKSANNLVSSNVKSGMVLVIPPRSVANDDHVADVTTKPETYRVKQGDSIARISRKTGVKVAELKRLNQLGKGKLKPGQMLVLRNTPQAAEEKPKLAKHHNVYRSDLFSERDYEQSLAELMDVEQDQTVDLQKNVELNAENIRQLKKTAYGFLGTRYRFGGTTRRGLDCSSFVQQVFREMEVSLPRTAREQFEIGDRVSPGDLQRGDLIFFRTYASFPSHVGIYLGKNKMIHASSRDRRVVVSTIDTPYYRSRFIGAKRIPKINAETLDLDELFGGVEEEDATMASENDTLGLRLGTSN